MNDYKEITPEEAKELLVKDGVYTPFEAEVRDGGRSWIKRLIIGVDENERYPFVVSDNRYNQCRIKVSPKLHIPQWAVEKEIQPPRGCRFLWDYELVGFHPVIYEILMYDREDGWCSGNQGQSERSLYATWLSEEELAEARKEEV
jgi:hypothetical protein